MNAPNSAGQDHLDRADALLIGQGVDQHGGHKRTDDGADGQQMGKIGEYHQRDIANKACAARHANGGGRGHGVAHYTLQNTAGERQAHAHQPTAQDAREAQMPDQQAGRAVIRHKETAHNLPQGKMNGADAHANQRGHDAQRAKERDQHYAKAAMRYSVHSFCKNTFVSSCSCASSCASGWPSDSFCFSNRSWLRWPFSPSGMRRRRAVRARSMLPRHR